VLSASATASWPAAPKHSGWRSCERAAPWLAQGSRAAAYGLDARVATIPRVETARLVAETSGRAERGARSAPDWLQAITLWRGTSAIARRIGIPSAQDTAAREAYAHTVGEEGFLWLDARRPRTARGADESYRALRPCADVAAPRRADGACAGVPGEPPHIVCVSGEPGMTPDRGGH